VGAAFTTPDRLVVNNIGASHKGSPSSSSGPAAAAAAAAVTTTHRSANTD